MTNTKILDDTAGLGWLRTRQHFLGASDAPVIAGLSRWSTQYDLYLSKTSPVIVDDDRDLFHFAKALELPIIERVRTRYPEFASARPGDGLFSWDEHPVIAATPDGYVDHGGAERSLQIKTVGPYARKSWGDAQDENDVPDDYRIQVMIENAVLDQPYGFIVPLFGLTDLGRPIRINTDAEFIAWYVERAEAWWQTHVVEGLAPDPELGDDLVERYRGVIGSKITATDDIAARARRGKRYRDIERKDAEAIDEADKFAIQAFMGEATELLDPQTGELLVTWRPKRSPAVFNLGQLRIDHPDLVEAYTIEGKPQRSTLYKPTAQSKLDLLDFEAEHERKPGEIPGAPAADDDGDA